MGIFLLVLKIIGIILAVLLLIIVIAALSILFIPIRYEIEAEKKEKIFIRARISWLLRMITVRAGYSYKEEPFMYCKFFGFKVFDYFHPKEKKEKKHKQKKKRPKKEKVKKQKVNKKDNAIPLSEVSDQKEVIQTYESYQENIISDHEENIKEIESDKDEKTGIIDKIKAFINKLILFFKKLIDKLKNIKYTIDKLVKNCKNLKTTVSWYLEVLGREDSKKAIAEIKRQLGKFLHHIKPRKCKVNFVIGTDDPAKTADIFMYICMLYPLYVYPIKIIPDFKNEIFEGDFHIKGRIQPGIILKIAWTIFFDKEIKQLYQTLTGGMQDEQ